MDRFDREDLMTTPDRYTKMVLTIIAAALVWMCVRDGAPTIQARVDQDAVRLTGFDERQPLAVKIVGIQRGTWVDRSGPDAKRGSQAWESIKVDTPAR